MDVTPLRIQFIETRSATKEPYWIKCFIQWYWHTPWPTEDSQESILRVKKEALESPDFMKSAEAECKAMYRDVFASLLASDKNCTIGQEASYFKASVDPTSDAYFGIDFPFFTSGVVVQELTTMTGKPR